MQATVNADRSTTVAKSTDDAIGSATAAFIFDNTASKLDVTKAYEALGRALRREFGKASDPADVPTSGSSVE